MAVLPPVIGHFTRTRVIVLVTGRTAVARVGGVTAVRRHVATAARLGLDPLVLYPSRMKALGAEIVAELDGAAECLPADELDDRAGQDQDLALVIAGDWYVAPSAILAFDTSTRGSAVARFEEHGRPVAPLARISVAALRALIPKLANSPSGELIDAATEPGSTVVTLPVIDRHRLSDNVAVARCEAKLFGWVGDEGESPLARGLQRWLAVPFTRRLVGTSITPAQVAASKFVVGILAAVVVARGGYAAGVAGAALYFVSRMLDSVSGNLSRAIVVEGVRGNKADVLGDVVAMFAMLVALALHVGGPSAWPAAWTAALIAATGITISSAVAYMQMFRILWEPAPAGRTGWREHSASRPDSFPTRFWTRHGLALALLLAALIGRLDLFLWAAAIGAHLYYIAWLSFESEQRS